MKRILIPTDFSENALNAADFGLRMYQYKEYEIIMLHVFQVPALTNSVILEHDALKSEAIYNLHQEVKRIRASSFRNIVSEYSARLGSLVSVVDRLVKEGNIDLIIMGTKGASGFKEVLFGSNTADVIEKVDCPILVIPPKARFKQPERILLAVDNKGVESPQVLEPLLRTAKEQNSHIMILSAGQPPLEDTEKSRIEKYLAKVPHSFHSIYVAENIHEFVKHHDVGLISVSPKTYGLSERLFRKSVTKQLLFYTKIPLFLIPDRLKSVPS